jgi:RNA polymerase sigma factor (sigma-70 family)
MAVKNSTSRQAELVDAHLPLVRHIARSLSRSLSRSLPPSFPIDDLVQEGVIGLLHAAKRYDSAAHPTPGSTRASFSTFAHTRIRGAMLESVRRRHWTANTCLPFRTADESDGVPLPACAPTQAAQAERRDQLCRIAEAATWLTADRRCILSMRYGSAEMTMPAIAEELCMSLRMVFFEHDAAITEIQRHLGLHGRATPRRYSSVPKPTQTSKVVPISVSPAAALEADRKKNLDELGELDQFFAPLKSKLTRQASLREWARGMYDDADATRGFEASGDRFTVLIGPRSNVSTVDIVALIKKIGIKLFGTFAKTTLKDLALYTSPDVAASVTSVAQTGSRSVSSYERGTPAKKAA